MSRAVQRYMSELEKDKSWRKPQNGSTFFKSGYIDYLDANFEPSKQKSDAAPGSFNDFQQRDYDYAELEKMLLENSQNCLRKEPNRAHKGYPVPERKNDKRRIDS